MIERRSGLIVPKSHKKFSEIESNLHRFVPRFNGGYDEKFFYEDLGESILIPRYYPVGEKVIDNSCEGDDIEIDHSIVPRSDRQKKAIDFLTNTRNAVLQLEPGSGKTVLSIAAIANIKKRTIIIVHKDSLLEQWEKEIYNHTDLTKDDVCRLSSKNYAKCFSKKIILTTPHVIAYNATHDKTEFMKALETSGIGLLIVDEVHVGVGPEQFSKASIFVNAKRTIGLSATPTRADGNDDLILFHLGKTKYFEPNKNELLPPTIHMVKFPFGTYSNYKKYLHFGGGKFNLSRYYKQLGKKGIYNKVASTWIRQAYEKGRKVLVLGKNIEPLLNLAEECRIPPEDLGIFIKGAVEGETSKKHLKRVTKLSDTTDLYRAFYTKSVVISTYTSGRDGNSRNDFDALFMVTSTGNVEQAIGRVQRLCENKKDVIVVDFIDEEGPNVPKKGGGSDTLFNIMAQKRLKIYEEKGWEVKIHKLEKKEKSK
jgi:superfamily II DNA or RNA helicase